MSEFFTSIPGIIIVIGLLVLTIRTFLSSGIRAVWLNGIPPREWMQIILSVVIVAAGLYIILSRDYTGESEKWAYGSIGTILGYWLPGKAS